MIRAAVLFAACAVAAPASARDAIEGRYRAAEGPDVAAELLLRSDGRFEYGLSAGALDQQAKGRWVRADGQVRLFTEPKPIAPVFSEEPASITKEAALEIHVSWPNGRGIANIDVRIGFATGDPVDGYTQDYGWSLPEGETRTPLWVELSQSMFGLVSPRFPIDVKKANRLKFMLTPNDLGTVDFEGALVEVQGDRLTLHLDGGTIRFVRSD